MRSLTRHTCTHSCTFVHTAPNRTHAHTMFVCVHAHAMPAHTLTEHTYTTQILSRHACTHASAWCACTHFLCTPPPPHTSWPSCQHLAGSQHGLPGRMTSSRHVRCSMCSSGCPHPRAPTPWGAWPSQGGQEVRATGNPAQRGLAGGRGQGHSKSQPMCMRVCSSVCLNTCPCPVFAQSPILRVVPTCVMYMFARACPPDMHGRDCMCTHTTYTAHAFLPRQLHGQACRAPMLAHGEAGVCICVVPCEHQCVWQAWCVSRCVLVHGWGGRRCVRVCVCTHAGVWLSGSMHSWHVCWGVSASGSVCVQVPVCGVLVPVCG